MHAHGLMTETPRNPDSIPGLIRDAIEDAREWVKSEIALARAEVVKAAEDYAAVAVAWAVAAVLVLLGLVYLGFAVILLLSPYLGAAGAAAVVALAMLLAALAAFLYGRAKFLRARPVPARLERALQPSHLRRRGDLH